jgi:DNA polymerase III sliding clamp (beta) subunit (PCNA family)
MIELDKNNLRTFLEVMQDLYIRNANVILKNDGDFLSLFLNSHAITAKVAIEKSDSQINCSLPVEKLCLFLKDTSDDIINIKSITNGFELSNRMSRVSLPNTSYTFFELPANQQEHFLMNKEFFIRAIQNVLPFVHKDEFQDTIKIEFGNELKVFAYNGNAATIMRENLSCNKQFSICLKAKFLSKILKALSKLPCEDIEIFIPELQNYIGFQCDNFRMTLSTLNTNFPDIEKILLFEPGRKISIFCEELVEVLNQIKDVSNAPTEFTLKGERLYFSNRDDTHIIEGSVLADFEETDEITFSLQANVLLEAIKVLQYGENLDIFTDKTLSKIVLYNDFQVIGFPTLIRRR